MLLLDGDHANPTSTEGSHEKYKLGIMSGVLFSQYVESKFTTLQEKSLLHMVVEAVKSVFTNEISDM